MKIRFTKQETARLSEAIAKAVPRYAPQMRVAYRYERGMWLDWGEVKRKHTPSQQGYYWAMLEEAHAVLHEQLGISQDEFHHAIKRDTFGVKHIESPIGPIERVKSSAGLNIEEYGLMIDTLIRICAFMDYQIPDPRKQEIAA